MSKALDWSTSYAVLNEVASFWISCAIYQTLGIRPIIFDSQKYLENTSRFWRSKQILFHELFPFYQLSFIYWTTSGSVQRLPLWITHNWLRKQFEIIGIKPGTDTCKASTLSAALLLQLPTVRLRTLIFPECSQRGRAIMFYIHGFLCWESEELSTKYYNNWGTRLRILHYLLFISIRNTYILELINQSLRFQIN